MRDVTRLSGIERRVVVDVLDPFSRGACEGSVRNGVACVEMVGFRVLVLTRSCTPSSVLFPGPRFQVKSRSHGEYYLAGRAGG